MNLPSSGSGSFQDLVKTENVNCLLIDLSFVEIGVRGQGPGAREDYLRQVPITVSDSYASGQTVSFLDRSHSEGWVPKRKRRGPGSELQGPEGQQPD